MTDQSQIMPTSTFNRLPRKKRLHFIEVATREFALNHYNDASISRIVRTLGIAKGSVYQYFENKADLYEYLVLAARNKLLEILKFVDQRGDENLPLWFVQRLLAELRFAHEFPFDFSLLNKVSHQLVSPNDNYHQLLKQEELSMLEAIIRKNPLYQKEAPAIAKIVYALKHQFLEEHQDNSLSEDPVDQLNQFAYIIFGQER